MDRARRCATVVLCGAVWRQTMGLCCKGFRFEGWRESIRGLNRTGKSCRLRWVNYLQPGLKRGKMTPQEEKLVLDLHSVWGNRWSRIASKLPGRTDNEIKNYWRTYMRKKKGRASSSSFKTLPSLSTSCSSASNDTKLDSLPSQEIGEEMISRRTKLDKNHINIEDEQQSMDDVWREIALSSEDNVITPANHAYCSEETRSFFSPPYYWNKMDDKQPPFYDAYYDLYGSMTTTSFN